MQHQQRYAGNMGNRTLLLCLACSSTLSTSSRVSIGNVTTPISPTFVAHGWEPWTATQVFAHFREPAFRTAFSHLRGQTIRFGGISADWLRYVVNDTVSEPCEWGERRPWKAGELFWLVALTLRIPGSPRSVA